MDGKPTLSYQCRYPPCKNSYFKGVKNTLSFFRFPNDTERRQKWFDVMNADLAEKVLFTSTATYLCEDHFEDACFTSTLKRRLHKYAVPSVFHTQNGALPKSIPINNLAINTNCRQEKPRKVYREIKFSRVAQSTPRKKKYLDLRRQKQAVCKLRHILSKCKDKIKCIEKLSKTRLFDEIESNLHHVGAKFIRTQFVNVVRQKPKYSSQFKALALSLYKRGPRCYKFMENYVQLPSKSTLHQLLTRIPFDSGINHQLISRLSQIVKRIKIKHHKFCTILFDEISLSSGLVYSRSLDKIVGLVDLGELGRTNENADHALVFMVTGINKSFKQLVAYYFTKDSISATNLSKLIDKVVIAVQSTGLIPILTICDQARTHRKAIADKMNNSTLDNPGLYYYVNNNKIYHMWDTPHLLKNTRTTLASYSIQFDSNKVAQFRYVREAFEKNCSRKYTLLPNFKRQHLDIVNPLKVSVAAKTMSRSMAATIETMVASGTDPLPSEAMYTAEFVHDVNNLFDSFNSKKRKGTTRYCRRLSKNSIHTSFWEEMYEKIECWTFFPNGNGPPLKKMPVKSGWLHNLRVIFDIWDICKTGGMKSLGTRTLCQDPLENLFSAIRGSGNSDPNCDQFIAFLKTSVLNNLEEYRGPGSICEVDGVSVLDNFQTFIEHRVEHDDADLAIISNNDNELFSETPPNFVPENLGNSESYDLKALTYVCGFIVRKIVKGNCEKCRDNLISNSVDSQYHIFPSFKEYNGDKQSPIYVSKNILLYVTHMQALIVFYIDKFISFSHLRIKLFQVLKRYLDFSWFSCEPDKEIVEKHLLTTGFLVTIKKHLKNKNFENESSRLALRRRRH